MMAVAAEKCRRENHVCIYASYVQLIAFLIIRWRENLNTLVSDGMQRDNTI